MDSRPAGDEDVERELRAYASARLSPDRWASARMRAAVLEQAQIAQSPAPSRHLLDVLAPFRVWGRRLAPVALVAALAVGAGGVAGVAASPGGPLYGTRLWIETALLPGGGEARFTAQQSQLGERLDEVTGAVDDGNTTAADAAAEAYAQQVDQTVSAAQQSRADLLQLRATLVRQLSHLQSLVKPNDKASANLGRLISKTQSALAEIDRKLAALGPANP